MAAKASYCLDKNKQPKVLERRRCGFAYLGYISPRSPTVENSPVLSEKAREPVFPAPVMGINSVGWEAEW